MVSYSDTKYRMRLSQCLKFVVLCLCFQLTVTGVRVSAVKSLNTHVLW